MNSSSLYDDDDLDFYYNNSILENTNNSSSWNTSYWDDLYFNETEAPTEELSFDASSSLIYDVSLLSSIVKDAIINNTANITDDDEDNGQNDLSKSTDTEILRGTLQVYGSLYLAVMIVFCIVRKKYPRLFNIRSWVEGLECEIAKSTSHFGYVSWLWQVFSIEEEDILEQCGMDALCFIRILRIGRKLSLIGCFHACWLIPVYATAEKSAETDYLTDRLVIISTSNLPSQSPRFLATIICAYTVFGYCMWLLKKEVVWYTTYRHKFLQLRKPRNYAVYVSGIPEELRSERKLADFFRQTAATSQVLEAHVTLACPELEALVEQRNTVQTDLKHAKAYTEIHGERETRFEAQVNLPWWCLSKSRKKKRRKKNVNNHETAFGIVAQVDSIEKLERKLRQLTKDISYAYQNIERANDPYTLEEHRKMVMEDIAELRRAEIEQSDANREDRLSGNHDMSHVEEIFHEPQSFLAVATESNDFAATSNSSRQDRFSQAVEHMFMGGLSQQQRNQQRDQEQELILQEQERLLLNNDTEPARGGGNRVRIHTSNNSFHSFNSVPSVEPTTDSDDNNLEAAPLVNGRPNLKRGFPSKSTITTAPGIFDDTIIRNNSSDTTSSGPPANPHFQYPGRYINMPNIQEDSNNDESFTNDESDGFVKIPRAGDGSEESEEDDIDARSTRSWGTMNESSKGSALRLLQNAGVNVGDSIKLAHEASIKSTKKSVKMVSELGLRNAKKMGDGVNKSMMQAAELGVENMKTIRATAAAVVPMSMMAGHREGMPLEAGFVVFKDLYTTQAALQMLHHETSNKMRVSEAPGIDEIFWPNVGLPTSAQKTGRLLSLAATTTLCFFWTIPIAFVSGLTEVNSLKEQFPFLGKWVEKYPGLEEVLALVAPLLLLILQDVILPEFLIWFAAWEGHIASSNLEASMFVKYAAFVLVQTFFISAISGSITAELTNILNEPKNTIDFLANALPAQSTYFLQILLVAMAVNMGAEMLRAQPLGLAFARKFVGPRLTEEERKKQWKFLAPLEDPHEFEQAKILGTVVLYFMVFLVYAPLAPVSSFFIFAMFFMMEAGYRYQFPHNYPATPDSGGQHWLGMLHILQCCLVVAQLTLLGFLLLKRSFYAVPFMTPLLAMTVLFIIYINKYQLHSPKYLPTSDCVRVDKENRLKAMEFAKGVYQQPCIKEAQSEDIFEFI